MRDLGRVIDAVVQMIPDVPGGSEVVYRLHGIKRDSQYTAPEILVLQWRVFVDALVKGLPNPGPGAPEWVNRIKAVVDDRVCFACGADKAPAKACVCESFTGLTPSN